MSMLIGIKLRSAYNSSDENRFFIGCLLWGCQKSLSILKNCFITASAIPSSGKFFYDNADDPAKMTDIVPGTGQLTDSCNDFTLGYRRCWSLIIHVFLFRWFLAMSPTILCQPMGAFAFFALTIAPLCLPVRRPPGTQPTVWTAIGLSPPATPADAKGNMATTTNNRYQQHAICTLLLAGVRVINEGNFRPYPDWSSFPKSPKWRFRAFSH